MRFYHASDDNVAIVKQTNGMNSGKRITNSNKKRVNNVNTRISRFRQTNTFWLLSISISQARFFVSIQNILNIYYISDVIQNIVGWPRYHSNFHVSECHNSNQNPSMKLAYRGASAQMASFYMFVVFYIFLCVFLFLLWGQHRNSVLKIPLLDSYRMR